jgi:hypothetical protein
MRAGARDGSNYGYDDDIGIREGLEDEGRGSRWQLETQMQMRLKYY